MECPGQWDNSEKCLRCLLAAGVERASIPICVRELAVGAAGSAEGEGFTPRDPGALLNWPAVEILSARGTLISKRFIHKFTHPYLRTRSMILSRLHFLSTFSSGWFFRNAVFALASAWPRLVLVKAGCQIS